jgi:hypothetical protein
VSSGWKNELTLGLNLYSLLSCLLSGLSCLLSGLSLRAFALVSGSAIRNKQVQLTTAGYSALLAKPFVSDVMKGMKEVEVESSTGECRDV